MDFRYRLMRFMSGRNGPDELFVLIFAVSVALAVVNIFVRSYILQAAVYAVMLLALFRLFSRKTDRRRQENEKLLKLLSTFRRKKDFNEQKRADKCHVYKKCPSCKAVLRLPKRPGVHKTVCPRCGMEFTVRVRK